MVVFVSSVGEEYVIILELFLYLFFIGGWLLGAR